MNAFSLPKNIIVIGEELISKLTIGEKTFVISHEFAHILEKHRRKKSIRFFIFIICLLFISLISNYFINAYLLISFSIFISGIIGSNLISWQLEYDADRKALQLTKDKNSLESALNKLKEGPHDRDYGVMINLILYDHPLINDRIKRCEKFSQ